MWAMAWALCLVGQPRYARAPLRDGRRRAPRRRVLRAPPTRLHRRTGRRHVADRAPQLQQARQGLDHRRRGRRTPRHESQGTRRRPSRTTDVPPAGRGLDPADAHRALHRPRRRSPGVHDESGQARRHRPPAGAGMATSTRPGLPSPSPPEQRRPPHIRHLAATRWLAPSAETTAECETAGKTPRPCSAGTKHASPATTTSPPPACPPDHARVSSPGCGRDSHRHEDAPDRVEVSPGRRTQGHRDRALVAPRSPEPQQTGHAPSNSDNSAASATTSPEASMATPATTEALDEFSPHDTDGIARDDRLALESAGHTADSENAAVSPRRSP